MLSGESKRASSTIVQHSFADGRHLVTCDPDLGVEFEMGTSQVLWGWRTRYVVLYVCLICRLICLPCRSQVLGLEDNITCLP